MIGSIHPNPSGGATNLTLQLITNHRVITLADASGRIVDRSI